MAKDIFWDMGKTDINEFLTDLTVKGKFSASTWNGRTAAQNIPDNRYKAALNILYGRHQTVTINRLIMAMECG